jgi:hypothetical protein
VGEKRLKLNNIVEGDTFGDFPRQQRARLLGIRNAHNPKVLFRLAAILQRYLEQLVAKARYM